MAAPIRFSSGSFVCARSDVGSIRGRVVARYQAAVPGQNPAWRLFIAFPVRGQLVTKIVSADNDGLATIGGVRAAAVDGDGLSANGVAIGPGSPVDVRDKNGTWSAATVVSADDGGFVGGGVWVHVTYVGYDAGWDEFINIGDRREQYRFAERGSMSSAVVQRRALLALNNRVVVQSDDGSAGRIVARGHVAQIVGHQVRVKFDDGAAVATLGGPFGNTYYFHVAGDRDIVRLDEAHWREWSADNVAYWVAKLSAGNAVSRARLDAAAQLLGDFGMVDGRFLPRLTDADMRDHIGVADDFVRRIIIANVQRLVETHAAGDAGAAAAPRPPGGIAA